jgi:hypothetical protein
MKTESKNNNKVKKKVNGKLFSSEYQPPEKWTEERALQLGSELIEWLKEKDSEGNDKGNIFYEEFLIIEKDLYPQIVSFLKEKFPSFLKLLQKANKIQELKLQKFGTADRLNAAMTKFVLINKHNWCEKQEITGKDGKDFNNFQVTGIIIK